MVKFKGVVDTSLRGKHGRTALHEAAIHDHADCAKILVSYCFSTSTSRSVLDWNDDAF